MKNFRFKNVFSICVFVLLSMGCVEDDRDLDYLNDVQLPSNLALEVQLAQDNSGTATLTPSGDSASSFLLDFGDGSEAVTLAPGTSVNHTYNEGSYPALVTASNINGETAEFVQTVVVSFLPPENLEVTINPVSGDAFSIEVSATADLAVGFEVYFGDVADEDPTPLMVLETITHTYAEVGSYDVRVVALSGGVETIEVTQTVVIVNPIALPIDFESTTIDYVFGDFGGAVNTVIDNPDPTGGNTSLKVAEFFKEPGAELFAGTALQLGASIDFSENQSFRINSWSPQAGITVKLKIENASDGTISAEIDAVTSATNSWETLFFDFSEQDLTQDYSKVIVFFDFGNPGAGTTYYFDDIAQTNVSSEPFESFEDFEGAPPVFTVFGDIDPTVVVANPSIDGVNGTSMTAQLTKTAGSQPWAGTFFELTNQAIDFGGIKKLKFKSYAPASGKTIKLKLENQDATITHEVDVTNGVANAWEELIFDFEAADAADYVRVVVFYDFDVPGDGSLYYFDEMEVGQGSISSTLPEMPIEDFEGTPPPFTVFGNIAGTNIVANPNMGGINGSAMSASQEKTVGSEVWAGCFFEVATPLDLVTFSKINVKTLVPGTGKIVKVKIENIDATITHEVDITNTVDGDWELMSYDFSGAPPADYIRIVIFFDFNVAGDGTTYLFDEIELAN